MKRRRVETVKATERARVSSKNSSLPKQTLTHHLVLGDQLPDQTSKKQTWMSNDKIRRRRPHLTKPFVSNQQNHDKEKHKNQLQTTDHRNDVKRNLSFSLTSGRKNYSQDKKENSTNCTFDELRSALGNPILTLLNKFSEHSWYDIKNPLSSLSNHHEGSDEIVTCSFSNHENAIIALKSEGERYARLLAAYVTKSNGSKRDLDWYQTLVSKGTSYDRIHACTLLIQQCPLGRIDIIKLLLKSASTPSRREASIACEALKDLFINDLLPTNRKLYFFKENPLLQKIVNNVGSKPPPPKRNSSEMIMAKYQPSDLILIWFEDFLKTTYTTFLLILASGAKDPIQFFKRNCIKYSFDLLGSCPEQEKGLLAILISGLMDSSQKYSAMSYSLLRELLTQHPPMKAVVGHHIVEAVLSRLALNHSTSLTTLHRPVLFLSELQYLRKEKDFAEYMVNAFLQILHYLVKKFDQGVASPENQLKKKKLIKRLIKKKTHSQSVRTQQSAETVKKTESEVTPNDRLFRAVLNGLSRVIPYVGVEHLPDMDEDCKVLDKLIGRVESPAVKIAILNILHRLVLVAQRDTNGLFKLIYSEIRYFSLYHSTNRNVLLTIINKLLEWDTISDRSLAIFRRLNQVCYHTDLMTFQLVLLSELIKVISKSSVTGIPIITQSDHKLLEESTEEICKDVPLNDDPASLDDQHPSLTCDLPAYRGYNPRGGDPKFARPDCSHLWELDLQACSVYPPISTYASSIKQWAIKNPTAQPPVLQTVIALEKSRAEAKTPTSEVLSNSIILDLLAYKQHPSQKSSKMDTVDISSPLDDKLITTKNGALSSTDITSMSSVEFWKSKKRILPHETFLAQYFMDEYIQRKLRKPQDNEEPEDIDDLGISKGEEEMDLFLDDVLAKELGTNELVDSDDASMNFDHEYTIGDSDYEDAGDKNDTDGADDFGETFSINDDESDDDEKEVNEVKPKSKRSKINKSSSVFASIDDYQDILI